MNTRTRPTVRGFLQRDPLAEVRTYDRGMTWELWWRGELLTGSTNEKRVRDFADRINVGRSG